MWQFARKFTDFVNAFDPETASIQSIHEQRIPLSTTTGPTSEFSSISRSQFSFTF